MTTRTAQKEKETIFFITVTYHDWIPLFEITNSYDAVYNWFEVLRKTGNEVVGYVIMPNHVHALIYVGEHSNEINKLVANGKRFMAYEIVKRLKQLNKIALLDQMRQSVAPDEKKRGKLHQVFEKSFDCKPCYHRKFVEQKLEYIHRNPCSGKWDLADEYTTYKHSSAAFYELDLPGEFTVGDFRLLEWL